MTLLRVLTTSSIALILSATSILAGEYGKGDVYGQIGVYHETGLSKAMVGGGASALLGSNGNVALFGETNYIPLGNMGMPGISLDGFMVGGGVRAYLPIPNPRFRLYVPVAGGLMRVSGSGFGASASLNAGYFGVGVGAEFGNSKFGVRPEFRYLRVQQSEIGGNSVTIGTGVFYRFGS